MGNLFRALLGSTLAARVSLLLLAGAVVPLACYVALSLFEQSRSQGRHLADDLKQTQRLGVELARHELLQLQQRLRRHAESREPANAPPPEGFQGLAELVPDHPPRVLSGSMAIPPMPDASQQRAIASGLSVVVTSAQSEALLMYTRRGDNNSPGILAAQIEPAPLFRAIHGDRELTRILVQDRPRWCTPAVQTLSEAETARGRTLAYDQVMTPTITGSEHTARAIQLQFASPLSGEPWTIYHAQAVPSLPKQLMHTNGLILGVALALERISINASPRQFKRPDFYRFVKSTLKAADIPPQALEIEITETVLMEESEIPRVTIGKLASLGVRIAIDDFGTGYSSLAYLKRLPFHVLKIDRSFVRDVTTDEDARTIASTIIAMAHSLRKDVVAEGVDDPAQLTYLHLEQCDQVQGYLISPPLADEDFVQFLRSHSAKAFEDLRTLEVTGV